MLDEGVEVVSFFWGDPSPHVESVHSAGARVMHTVAGAEEARRAVDAGVDVVVAQVWEAGGHVCRQNGAPILTRNRYLLTVSLGHRLRRGGTAAGSEAGDAHDLAGS